MENLKFCAIQKLDECRTYNETFINTKKKFGLIVVDEKNAELIVEKSFDDIDENMNENIIPDGYKLIDFDTLVCKWLKEKKKKIRKRK